jgi:DNA repair protein RecN (Recombination protein N)
VLTTLRIKNLALVADLTLELEGGYNVITGETGAGKSILIGALNLVLGERAERGLIRSGTDNCVVEAVFDVRDIKAPVKAFLEENGLEPCEEHQLVLKRAFSTAGANRQFINGSPAALSVLSKLGEWLVDIHGPHDHQSLLQPARQLDLLDAFGKLEPARAGFGGLVRRRAGLEAEKAALIVDERSYAQQLDLLRFQAEEIGAAQLRAGEEGQLEEDYARAGNAAKLLQQTQLALELLGQNETSVLTQAGIVGRALHELQRVDSSASGLVALHEQAISLLQELQGELGRYVDKLDLDPERLQQLEERLNVIQSLKRKYGATLAEVIAFGEETARKLRRLEQRDAELQRINAELQKVDGELLGAGKALSKQRRKCIPQLSKAVAGQLADLGFKQSRFEIALASALPKTDAETTGTPRPTTHGFDIIDFQFAPNPGEPPRPLRGIASSGELARVMLAIKTVLAAEDQVPVLVFDEVDANVGGETANAVGEKMRQIARKRQVICITHLPQVAAPASAHYLADKQVRQGRTTSGIFRLGKEERVVELARMLGGKGEAARKHAEALLQ